MILNLTQHPATDIQKVQGVIDLPEALSKQVRDLLTFDDIPSDVEMIQRAKDIVKLVERNFFDEDEVLLGGAPFFMPVLDTAFKNNGYQCLYAFSRRESVEEVMADGTVRKTAVFRHLGFVRT